MNLELRFPRTIGPWPSMGFAPAERVSYVCDACGDYFQEIEHLDGWQLCEQCAEEYEDTSATK